MTEIKRTSKPHKLSTEAKENMRIDFESGMNQIDIAKKYDVSIKTVRYHIIQNGWGLSHSQPVSDSENPTITLKRIMVEKLKDEDSTVWAKKSSKIKKMPINELAEDVQRDILTTFSKGIAQVNHIMETLGSTGVHIASSSGKGDVYARNTLFLLDLVEILKTVNEIAGNTTPKSQTNVQINNSVDNPNVKNDGKETVVVNVRGK